RARQWAENARLYFAHLTNGSVLMPNILLRARGVSWFLALVVLLAQHAWSQDAPQAELQALEAAIAQACADKLEALSPAHFEAAVDAYAAAARDLERGRDAERVRARIAEGRAALANAAATGASVRK